MPVKAAIDRILTGEEDSILIPCKDNQHRNVLRTTATRRRLEIKKDENGPFCLLAEKIGISNKDINEDRYLRIFWKKSPEFFRELPDGSLEVIETTSEKDNRKELAETFRKVNKPSAYTEDPLKRTIRLMLADECSVEEILENCGDTAETAVIIAELSAEKRNG